MNRFWQFMKAAPKASLMIPVVMTLQVLKRFDIIIPGLDEKTVSDIFDILSAIAGIYGFYQGIKAEPPAPKHIEFKPVTKEEKK